MELTTVGRRYYPGYGHRLTEAAEDRLTDNPGLGSRYRLVLIMEGTGIARIGDALYPIAAPSLYCLNAEESFTAVESDNLLARSVYFHPALINGRFGIEPESDRETLGGADAQDAWCLAPFRERDADYDGCLPLDPAMSRHLASVMAELGQALNEQADTDWPCRSRSCLLELLFAIRRIYRRTSAALRPIIADNGELLPVLTYLHTRYRDPVRLEELTSLARTNRTTLNNRFRQSTGLSPIAYLHKLRMQLAASMLRNTLLPVSEIMERVGIMDDASFIRRFRKYAGCTPAQYRKMNCWML